jgi:hypothetical protein
VQGCSSAAADEYDDDHGNGFSSQSSSCQFNAQGIQNQIMQQFQPQIPVHDGNGNDDGNGDDDDDDDNNRSNSGESHFKLIV